MCGLIVSVVFFSSSLPSLCSLSQHCWFRVVSCGRVVSLWNSGDGLCRVEGRVVSTVYCLLLWVVVCVSVRCVCLVVLWVVVLLCCGMAVGG